MGDRLVSQYFQMESAKLSRDTANKLQSFDNWHANRAVYRRQLGEMLGLDPFPDRTPLNATVVGTLEHEDILVDRLHFQSLPGLYVTANLYRPKTQSGVLPAVLYVCGHGRSMTDGISNGCKARYQHHGGWFARNGYVCLIIDTIQLGEIEGIHHGTYHEDMWWWNNRGYTPAGVEAWNGIRALDYLETRPEVDRERLGVTGRSGGGGYSWWIAALDERIKAAVPVAGLTSLHNHVVDGCVEGHCDCMYMVNTYRWDYPMVAALVSPRALLISNTDKDSLFPLDGVVDVHGKVKRLYSQQGVAEKLGLHITEGPHKDTQELRIHAFRWMNRWLRKNDDLVDTVATPLFDPHELRVFSELPNDQLVTTIHETFVPMAESTLPTSRSEFSSASERWQEALIEKVFRGWPRGDQIDDLDVRLVRTKKTQNIRIREFQFTSQQPYRLSFYVIDLANGKRAENKNALQVSIVNQESWDQSAGRMISWLLGDTKEDGHSLFNLDSGTTHVLFAPRGIGPTEWTRGEHERTQVRRRFMQLGQTAASMQIWDVRRLLQALDASEEFAHQERTLNGTAYTATLSIFASLFQSNIAKLVLADPPATNRSAPDLLNISRVAHMPQWMLMVTDRIGDVELNTTAADADVWHSVVSSDLIRDRIKLRVTTP